MGVIHKLKPEIKDFILEQKKTNQNLSSRGLAKLVQDKFQIKLSKSTINSLFKTAGLSMPIGRRRKKRRYRRRIGLKLLAPQEEIKLLPEPKIEEKLPTEPEIETLPKVDYTEAMMLKAADYLISGGLYLNELQRLKTINLDVLSNILGLLREVRYLRVSFSDRSTLYLDGQLCTVWSTPNIPFDFNTTIYNIRSYINRYFHKDEPFVFFMAPGYDTPTPEFFNLILGLEIPEKNRITRLTLHGNKFEELEVIPIEGAKTRFFVFGLWPWQFVSQRKVKKMGEFKPFSFSPLSKDFYIADIELELLQPITKQVVTLKGCALKTNLMEKTRLIILSNLTETQTDLTKIAHLYLNHWPNLEEGLQDFNRKIELFTYTATAQRFFSSQNLNLKPEILPDIKILFEQYLAGLDLYVRLHFLPSGFEDMDFSTIKKEFYELKTIFKQEKDYTLVTFQVPQVYSYLKELSYACQRMNEREIFSDEKRLWLFIA